MRQRLIAALLVGVAALGLQTAHGEIAQPTPASSSVAVQYAAGWNLIAGAGVPVPGATGPLYTLQAGDNAYELIPAGTPLTSGLGYWAYFDRPTTVQLPAAGTSPTMLIPAQQFVMIGRPPFAGPTVHGTDPLTVYVYDPSTQQYMQTASPSPGQGAWVYTSTGARLTFETPGAPAR